MKYRSQYMAYKNRKPGQIVKKAGDYYILTTREDVQAMNGTDNGKIRMIANKASLAIGGPYSEIKIALDGAGIMYKYDNSVFVVEHITWELFYRITLMFEVMEVI